MRPTPLLFIVYMLWGFTWKSRNDYASILSNIVYHILSILPELTSFATTCNGLLQLIPKRVAVENFSETVYCKRASKYWWQLVNLLPGGRPLFKQVSCATKGPLEEKLCHEDSAKIQFSSIKKKYVSSCTPELCCTLSTSLFCLLFTWNSNKCLPNMPSFACF